MAFRSTCTHPVTCTVCVHVRGVAINRIVESRLYTIGCEGNWSMMHRTCYDQPLEGFIFPTTCTIKALLTPDLHVRQMHGDLNQK